MDRNKLIFKKQIPLLIIIHLLLLKTSFATLGEKISSITDDQRALRGVKKTLQRESYSVHEITYGGHQVKEYASNQGIVFAVTWRGNSEPDLSVLFGNYYSEYKEAKPVRRFRGRGPKQFQTRHLQVEKFGHMRDIRGKAYIPELIPNGVNIETINE